MRKAYKIFIVKPERTRSVGRTRHRSEDNIEVDLKEIECESVDWNHLAHDRGE
jgi:hypothetical protein